MNIPVLNTPTKRFASSIVFALALVGVMVSQAQPFTPGKVVVLAVGDGSTPLSAAAAPIQLIELLTTAPGAGNTLTLPSTGTIKITTSGTGITDGMMTLSAEKDRLIVPGYDAAAGTPAVAASASATVNRELFSIAGDGSFYGASFSTTGYDGVELRSGTASGSAFFGAGPTGGLTLYGTSPLQLTTAPTDARVIQIINGQTYFSSNAPGFSGISMLGSGIPVTSGQTSTPVAATSSAYGFSISPDSSIMYVADDVGGIIKYTRTGGTYSMAYTVNTIAVRGLAVDYTSTNPIIYATTAEATGNQVIKVTDIGSGSVPTTLYTATATSALRGIAFAPSCAASITLNSSSTICSGDSVKFTITGNPSGIVVYKINGGVPHTVTIGVNGRITLNSGPLTTNSFINLVSITTPACSATPLTGSVAVSVNPVPAAITGASFLCTGGTITLNETSTGGEWSSSNTAAATIGSSSGVVTTAGVGTTVISYTLPSSCYATRLISVNALPPAITGNTVICAGTPSTLSNTVTGGSWSSSDVAVANVGSLTGIVTGMATSVATVNITYSAGAGCIATTEVTVYPASLPVTGLSRVCIGYDITLADATPGGSWSSSNSTVAAVGSLSGIVSGIAAGTARISYSSPGGCVASKVITVSPLPVTILGSNTVCTGSTTNLSSATFAAGTWSSPGNAAIATVSATGTVTGVSPGTAGVTYTITNTGCYRAVVMTVNPTPAAITGANKVCKGATVTLNDVTPGGIWSSSNTLGAAIGSVSGTVTGLATSTTRITYTMPTGCRQSMLFTVNPIPAAITGLSDVCAGSAITLADLSPGGTWSVNNAAAVINPSTGVLTGVTAGTVTASYTFSTGCYITKTDTVRPLPTAIAGTPNVCAGLTTTLTSTPTGGIWSSSMPSVTALGSSSGEVSGTSPGTSLITYTLPTGCKTTRLFTVNVSPAPVAGPTNICIGGPVLQLTDPSGGGLWTSANTAAVAIGAGTGILTAVSAGSAMITYTLFDGCYTTYTVTSNITPAAITGANIVCQGITTVLSDATPGGKWRSANATVSVDSTTGGVTGASPGTATISYTMPSGCFVTAPMLIKLAPALIEGPNNFCMGTPGTLTDATLGGTWSSSNTSVANVGATSGLVSGVTAGNATISYNFLNGCSRTLAVTINPLPAAITGVGSVCVDATLPLGNATPGGEWSSSMHIIATIGSSSGIVQGVAPGTSHISYTLPTGCRTTAFVTVAVTPSVIAGPIILCKNSQISLVNTAGGGVWTSSNATVASTGTSLSTVLCTVTGLDVGTSTITYTIGACRATHEVSVSPIPSAIMGVTKLCTELTTTLYDSLAGGEWLSGDVSVATVGTAGIVTGNSAGTAVITYAVNAICQTKTIVTVNQSAAFAHITVHPAGPLCSNTLNQNFGSNIAQPAGTQFTWSVVNARLMNVGSDKQYSIISFEHPGDAIVTLSSQIPGTGCIRTDSFVTNIPATVAPLPAVAYYTDALVFLDNTADYYQWGYDDLHTFDSTASPNAWNQDYYLPAPDFANNRYWVISRHGQCMQKTYYRTTAEAGAVVAATVNIGLYPNPAESVLTVDLAGLSNNGPADLRISTADGKTVHTTSFTGNTTKVNVAGFARGVYFLTIEKNGAVLGSRTFVKG